MTTTGGTYAKIIPNIIAYGPSFPGQRDIAHLPNEWIGIKDLETDTIIYGLALTRIVAHERGDGMTVEVCAGSIADCQIAERADRIWN